MKIKICIFNSRERNGINMSRLAYVSDTALLTTDDLRWLSTPILENVIVYIHVNSTFSLRTLVINYEMKGEAACAWIGFLGDQVLVHSQKYNSEHKRLIWGSEAKVGEKFSPASTLMYASVPCITLIRFQPNSFECCIYRGKVGDLPSH